VLVVAVQALLLAGGGIVIEYGWGRRAGCVGHVRKFNGMT
jgi:hypothetical protein